MTSSPEKLRCGAEERGTNITLRHLRPHGVRIQVWDRIRLHFRFLSLVFVVLGFMLVQPWKLVRNCTEMQMRLTVTCSRNGGGGAFSPHRIRQE